MSKTANIDPNHPRLRFSGMKVSEFEAEMRKVHPFAEITLGGGGNIIVNTGMKVGHHDVVINTDFYLNDSLYDIEGEERLRFYKG